MKKLLKLPLLVLALVCAAELLTGCVASARPGVVVAGPAYYPPPRPYYHRYRPYYRPSRVVVVERAPVVVRPRPIIIRPRAGYYRPDASRRDAYRAGARQAGHGEQPARSSRGAIVR